MADKEEKQSEYEYIKVIGNEIYFYCDVDAESVLELNTAIKKLERELRIKYIELGLIQEPEIKIYIHSDGGELYSGLSAMDHIRTTKCKVVTIADGMAASAAAMMFLGGHHRLIKRNSYVLIHQLGTDGMWGKFEEMKDEMNNCNKLMEHMKQVVSEVTNLPENKIKRIMKHDLILSAHKCIKYGVADGYYDS